MRVQNLMQAVYLPQMQFTNLTCTYLPQDVNKNRERVPKLIQGTLPFDAIHKPMLLLPSTRCNQKQGESTEPYAGQIPYSDAIQHPMMLYLPQDVTKSRVRVRNLMLCTYLLQMQFTNS